MAWRVILTNKSIEDLQSIVRFIATRDSTRARKFGDLLIDRAHAIGNFPEIGRIVPERGKAEIREIIQGPYRDIYRIKAKQNGHLHTSFLARCSRGAGNSEPFMSKYLHVINIGIQNTLVYRMNFLFRAAFGLIPLMATIYLWRAVYAGKENPSVAGYSLAGMISYYLLVTVVDALTGVTEDDWQIVAEIKDGNLNQFLLKPIDYMAYRLCLFLSGRVIYMAVAVLPVGLFLILQREYFVAPASGFALVLFLGSLFMTALLQFFMSYLMAMLAFWVLEVSTFIFILFALEYVAGGHLFPIDILPPALAEVLKFTPFPYQLFFPVSVYLGRVEGPELWLGLGIQAFWTLFFFGLSRWVFHRGLRKYTAVGG